MNVLPWWVKPLLITALAGATLYGAEHFGYQRAASLYAGKLVTADAEHTRQLLHLTEQRLTEQAAQEAYQRLNEQAHQVGWELLQTKQQLEATQRQLKQRITDATHTDGPSFTGLGPDSLRLYRQFLGYSASGEAGLSKPTPDMLVKPPRPPAPKPGYRQQTFSNTPPTTASGASSSTPR